MRIVAIIFFLELITNSFAIEGYVDSAHSGIIRTKFGECLHTSYFDSENNGIVECGDTQQTLPEQNSLSKSESK